MKTSKNTKTLKERALLEINNALNLLSKGTLLI